MLKAFEKDFLILKAFKKDFLILKAFNKQVHSKYF